SISIADRCCRHLLERRAASRTEFFNEMRVAVCEVCGNEYDKPFQVWRNGRLMKFDRIECAIQVMRPACTGCDAHIMGRGIEVGAEMFSSPGRADQQSGSRRSSSREKS